MSPPSVFLDEDDIRRLIEFKNFLDELLENLEILSDEETMKGIREGLEDIRKGRVRPLKELLVELMSRHQR